ncbi:MAG: hypothetical protein ACNI27_02175 [Desulfovibrio sp.]
MKTKFFLFIGLCVLLSSFAFTPAYAGGDVAKDEVMSKFVSFSEEWVQKLNRNHTFSKIKKTVMPLPEGFQGKYHEIDKSTIVCTVKPTKSKKIPFLGILRYTESVYVSAADSRATAKKGPYSCDKQVRVTEIFNYSNGRWQF